VARGPASTFVDRWPSAEGATGKPSGGPPECPRLVPPGSSVAAACGHGVDLWRASGLVDGVPGGQPLPLFPGVRLSRGCRQLVPGAWPPWASRRGALWCSFGRDSATSMSAIDASSCDGIPTRPSGGCASRTNFPAAAWAGPPPPWSMHAAALAQGARHQDGKRHLHSLGGDQEVLGPLVRPLRAALRLGSAREVPCMDAEACVPDAR